MKLNELSTILYSNRGEIQFAILYDSTTNTDVESGAIDYIVKKYGEKEVKQIGAFENQILITL